MVQTFLFVGSEVHWVLLIPQNKTTCQIINHFLQIHTFLLSDVLLTSNFVKRVNTNLKGDRKDVNRMPQTRMPTSIVSRL